MPKGKKQTEEKKFLIKSRDKSFEEFEGCPLPKDWDIEEELEGMPSYLNRERFEDLV